MQTGGIDNLDWEHRRHRLGAPAMQIGGAGGMDWESP
jgi:hypothetical protein